jgi:NitT/TauT family transport system substrate-binding protein
VAGKVDFALHSLHALGPRLADRSLAVVTDLARPTGHVPWSAYIAKPEAIRGRRPEFVAFTVAIARALQWLRANSDVDVAGLIAPHYPGYGLAGLMGAIRRYRAVDVWPADPQIAPAHFEHFGRILTDIGWLQKPVPYAEQVDPTLAGDALASCAETSHVRSPVRRMTTQW